MALTGEEPVDFSRWPEKRVKEYQEVRLSERELSSGGPSDRQVETARPGEPGNVGIPRHRDEFFRGLKGITTGDVIELSTLSGSAVHVVDQIEIVDPHSIGVLRPRSRPSLTLVTCYPFYYVGSAPRRFIVNAALK